jgi:stage V sporulation protein G
MKTVRITGSYQHEERVMEITEVSISLMDDEKLKAFANIVLDDLFVVRGLKIIEHVGRYFIAMPSRKQKDGSFRDIAHPITTEFRALVEKAVLDKYWEEVKQSTQSSST